MPLTSLSPNPSRGSRSHVSRSVPVNPLWGSLAFSCATEYAALALGLVLLRVSDGWAPFRRSIYHGSDAQLWRYSFPLKSDTISSKQLLAVSLLAGPVVFAVCRRLGRISRLEAHHSAVLSLAAVVVAGLLTNIVKLGVGRPRPDFLARCWPGGASPAWDAQGRPVCAREAIDVDEGLKSFPSGHSSIAASGGVFLTLWLLGHLRAFRGGCGPLGVVAALTPSVAALWVGLTRIQDYWHHWEDVSAGLVLGSAVASLAYRCLYPSPFSADPGAPHPIAWPARLVEGAVGVGTGSGSGSGSGSLPGSSGRVAFGDPVSLGTSSRAAEGLSTSRSAFSIADGARASADRLEAGRPGLADLDDRPTRSAFALAAGVALRDRDDATLKV